MAMKSAEEWRELASEMQMCSFEGFSITDIPQGIDFIKSIQQDAIKSERERCAEQNLSLLQKLEVAKEVLKEYANEGNWVVCFGDTESLFINHNGHGYEPAKTALEAMKGI